MTGRKPKEAPLPAELEDAIAPQIEEIAAACGLNPRWLAIKLRPLLAQMIRDAGASRANLKPRERDPATDEALAFTRAALFFDSYDEAGNVIDPATGILEEDRECPGDSPRTRVEKQSRALRRAKPQALARMERGGALSDEERRRLSKRLNDRTHPDRLAKAFDCAGDPEPGDE